MRTFWIRTASAAVYVALFLGAIYSGRLLHNNVLGGVILTAFALFVALGCAFEYYRMVQHMDFHPCKPIGYVMTTLMVLVVSSLGIEFDNLANALFVCRLVFFWVGVVLLFLSLPLTLVVKLWGDGGHPFSDVLHTLLPVIYCALPLSLMPLLHYYANVLVMCVAMVWINDSFAYMGGSLVGRHKMWTKHSPGKTWEGTAIGVLACVAFGFFVGPLFVEASCWYWLAMGLVCGVVGTLGDLVESMLKRAAGVKDSGSIMPGHGGFLDRFDSLLLILPVVTVLTVFIL